MANLFNTTRREKSEAMSRLNYCQNYNSLLRSMTAKTFPEGEYVDYFGNPSKWHKSRFKVVLILSKSKNCSSCLVSEVELLEQIKNSLPDDISLFCFNYAFDDLEMKTKMRILGVKIPVFCGTSYKKVANLLNENLDHFDHIFFLLDATNHIVKAAACSAAQSEEAMPIIYDFMEIVEQW